MEVRRRPGGLLKAAEGYGGVTPPYGRMGRPSRMAQQHSTVCAALGAGNGREARRLAGGG